MSCVRLKQASFNECSGEFSCTILEINGGTHGKFKTRIQDNTHAQALQFTSKSLKILGLCLTLKRDDICSRVNDACRATFLFSITGLFNSYEKIGLAVNKRKKLSACK